ncbi:hypothetical protein GGI07_004806, partial [Coemansia sp. Benny D115]
MLIKCGIDPWAPLQEIQMRQCFASALISLFNCLYAFPTNAEYAWIVENLTYRLSYSPDCAGNWAMKSSGRGNDHLVQSHRYRHLCMLTLKKSGSDKSLVFALLSGSISPPEFC